MQTSSCCFAAWFPASSTVQSTTPTAPLSQCKPVCLFPPISNLNQIRKFKQACAGNTIFVGLGGSTPYTTKKPYGWAKSLTSIGCFLLGALFFSNFCRYLGPLRRTTLIHSFLIQSLMIIFTAAIIAGGYCRRHTAPRIPGNRLEARNPYCATEFPVRRTGGGK